MEDFSRVKKYLAWLVILFSFLITVVFNFSKEQSAKGEFISNYVAPVKTLYLPKVNPNYYSRQDQPFLFLFANYFAAQNMWDVYDFFVAFRVFVMFLLLYGFWILARSYLNYKFSILALFLLLFDYGTTFYFVSDQFRNLFALPFFYLFLNDLMRKDNKALIWGITAMFIHKMFLLCVPLIFILYWVFSRYKKRIISFVNVGTVIVSCLVLVALGTYCIKQIGYAMPSIGKRIVNTSGLGIQMLLKRGIWLQLGFHLFFFFFLFKNLKFIKKNANILYIFLLGLLGVLMGRVELFSIDFVEPNRLYQFVIPLCIIVVAYVIQESKDENLYYKGLVALSFPSMWFLITHFSRGTHKPLLKLLSTPIIHYVNFSQLKIIFILVISFFISRWLNKFNYNKIIGYAYVFMYMILIYSPLSFFALPFFSALVSKEYKLSFLEGLAIWLLLLFLVSVIILGLVVDFDLAIVVFRFVSVLYLLLNQIAREVKVDKCIDVCF